MLVFSKIVNSFFNSFERFEHYAYASDEWLTGANVDELVIPLTTHIRLLVTYSFLLFMGKNVIKYEPKLTIYYNIMTIGIVLFPAMNPIELFFRINYVMLIFQCIISAYCFYFIFKKKIKVGIILRLLAYVTLFFYIYNIEGQFLEDEPHKILYIWDSAGRDYIPVSDYKN